jgi:GNAT superfamily N-acetyltransferase
VSPIEVAVTDPRHPDARHCIEAYFAEAEQRFDGGFDASRILPAGDLELAPPGGLLLIARRHGDPVGCGGLIFRPGGVADVKRMWVSPGVRGLGLGRRILAELEGRAAARGVHTLRLETNRALAEAIGLYRSAGYREVAAFNDEPHAHHWFEKAMPAP